MIRWTHSIFALALLLPGMAWSAGNPRLALPDFSALEGKASDSVNITLDAPLLAMASRFLDSSDPQDAATAEVIKGLQGIYVRSYSFDQDFVYTQSAIDTLKKQLMAPGWNLIVDTHSQKTRANVEIYMMTDNNKAVGLALIASEPRQLTVVNIIGSIDLQKLRQLEGRFGVPTLPIGATNAPAGNASRPAPR